MDVELDIQAFGRAIQSLEVELIRQAQAPDDDMLLDACIQRFEFVYELSHKTLRRFLRVDSASSDEIDALTFPDLTHYAVGHLAVDLDAGPALRI